MKRIWNSLGIVIVGRMLYWLWLEFDLRSHSELPQYNEYIREKINRYKPF